MSLGRNNYLVHPSDIGRIVDSTVTMDRGSAASWWWLILRGAGQAEYWTFREPPILRF